MADLSATQIALLTGGLVILVGYVTLILAPAWSSYGRTWEKLAASFLSLYVLIALVGTGVVIGVAIVFFYPNFA